MKTIKITTIVLIGLLAFACGSKSKEDQLNKLMKQRDELSEQIKKLEGETKSKDSTQTGLVKTIAVSEVKNEAFNHFIQLQGKIDGDENIAITPKAAGVITSKNVEDGAKVSKGQVIAQIDDAVYQQNLKEAMINLEYINDTYNKVKRLWDQKIGSEDQFLKAKIGKETTERKIAALKEQIEMCKIIAPITGSIEDLNIKVGQMVSPAMPTPVCKIVNFNKLKIVAEVSEAYASKVGIGDNLQVTIPDINYQLTSKVTYVSKFISAVNRTFLLESKISELKGNLKANMVCVIRINDYTNPKAIVLPINVIQNDQKDAYVYVSENNVAKKVIVKLGQSYNGLAEIVNGLKLGDKVITTGYQELVDGQSIKL